MVGVARASVAGFGELERLLLLEAGRSSSMGGRTLADSGLAASLRLHLGFSLDSVPPRLLGYTHAWEQYKIAFEGVLICFSHMALLHCQSSAFY